MWVYLPEWMVADEEPPSPVAGGVLAKVGLRVRGDLSVAEVDTPDRWVDLGSRDPDPRYRRYAVTGEAGPVRSVEAGMEREGAQHFGAELVMTVGRARFQVQCGGFAVDVPAGSRVTVRGTVAVIGDYEWNAFDLQDTRTNWRVERGSCTCRMAIC